MTAATAEPSASAEGKPQVGGDAPRRRVVTSSSWGGNAARRNHDNDFDDDFDDCPHSTTTTTTTHPQSSRLQRRLTASSPSLLQALFVRLRRPFFLRRAASRSKLILSLLPLLLIVAPLLLLSVRTSESVRRRRTRSSWPRRGAAALLSPPDPTTNAARHAIEARRNVPPWLDEYVSFHRNSTYVDARTGQRRLKPGAKYLVYRCTSRETRCGGIGDRINGILSLLYVAVTTGRVFVIDATKPFPLMDALVPNRIRWDVSYDVERRKGSFERIDLGVRRDWPPFHDPMVLDETVRGYAVTTGQWVGGYLWESEAMASLRRRSSSTALAGAEKVQGDDDRSPHHLYRWGFWTLFRFGGNVLHRAEELKGLAGLARRIPNNDDGSGGSRVREGSAGDEASPSSSFLPYIAVHVRTGDPGPGSSFRDPPRHSVSDAQERFLSCGRAFQGRLLNDNLTNLSGTGMGLGLLTPPQQHQKRDVLVSSDSPSVRSALRSAGGDVKSVPDLPVFHVDKSKPRPFTLQFWTVDPRSAHLDAWAEVVTLIDSECLVRSRSGFSELAHRVVSSSRSMSKPSSSRRCGVIFDRCGPDDVSYAVSALKGKRFDDVRDKEARGGPEGTAGAGLEDLAWVINYEGEA